MLKLILLAGIAAVLASTGALGAAALAAPCPGVDKGLPSLPRARFEDGPMLSTVDLVSDLDGWLSEIRALNPDLSVRTDPQALSRETARVRRSLTHPMSRREAWKHFTLLNPFLGDGHSAIQMPDYREALQAYVGGGGKIVPIEVRFGADKSLRVFATAKGVAEIEPGDRVDAVNGHPAALLVREMMRRSPGDTAAQRQAWMARRFAALYRLLYGDTGYYDLTFTHAGSTCTRLVRTAGATALPLSVQPQPAAQDLFAWRVFDAGVGYFIGAKNFRFPG